jgi:hypothetical protein
MHLFWDLFEGAPLLLQGVYLLQIAFTIWMAVDAYHRGGEQFWIWIIIIFQPLGPWIYFFAVKFRSLRVPGLKLGGGGGGWERKLSLEELRYRVERTPTLANRMALAQRLMDRGMHEDAITQLEAILQVEPGYCPALHALAECRIATGEPTHAVHALEKLLQRDRRWSHYRAWRTLIEAHLARREPGDALAACRELEKQVPNFENKCMLAEHLIDNGLKTEAIELLDQALEDNHYSPLGTRLRNWRWARTARKLLAEAERPTEKAN